VMPLLSCLDRYRFVGHFDLGLFLCACILPSEMEVENEQYYFYGPYRFNDYSFSGDHDSFRVVIWEHRSAK